MVVQEFFVLLGTTVVLCCLIKYYTFCSGVGMSDEEKENSISLAAGNAERTENAESGKLIKLNSLDKYLCLHFCFLGFICMDLQFLPLPCSAIYVLFIYNFVHFHHQREAEFSKEEINTAASFKK
ncbi:hypothetical protein IHE44_0005100 [Lamprotornis superbus]|uniref:Uncharacterized protein n=1 Tax=Lamprotornis superbus TaxID=245042 RepID=A0A835TWG1_9PASS|nr:hypothetical protein IHE44_0005100 [Lamprotornis superbus]